MCAAAEPGSRAGEEEPGAQENGNMGSTSKPRLLWFDCTSGLHVHELRIQCARAFQVSRTSRLERASDEIERLLPAVLVFDFDHPDQSTLHLMHSLKKAYPRLPILMLTLDHSEALAIWAFRARVWNYLVKPVAPEEFAENIDALSRIGNRHAPARAISKLVAPIPCDLPAQPLDAEVARLQPALRYIQQHYYERVSANTAAAACGLSRFEFSRRFRAAFRTTFRDYLLRLRIMEARRLLTEGGRSVTDVAFAVGFNDGSHFAHLFKRYTQMLPSQYSGAGYAAMILEGRATGIRADATPLAPRP